MTEQISLLDWISRYPETPGWKARETSIAAAQSMAPKAPTLREQCLTALEQHGPLTPDEVATKLDEDILSIRPRISELARLGKIHDTGARRRNSSGKLAIVWSAQ